MTKKLRGCLTLAITAMFFCGHGMTANASPLGDSTIGDDAELASAIVDGQILADILIGAEAAETAGIPAQRHTKITQYTCEELVPVGEFEETPMQNCIYDYPGLTKENTVGYKCCRRKDNKPVN